MIDPVPDALRRRRGEPEAVYNLRLTLMGEARAERAREEYRVAEAARTGGGAVPGERAPLLPALEQVRGWGKAKRRRCG